MEVNPGQEKTRFLKRRFASHWASMFRQLAPHTRRIVSIPHRAGLLAPGSKRFSIRLPIRLQNSGCSLHIKENELLTSYSSATASDSHRLPYSAWINGSRPPDENNSCLVFLHIVYARTVRVVKRIYM